MAKELNEGDDDLDNLEDNIEIIPPERRDKLRRPGVNLQTRLVTTGQIKSELGKMFREVRTGKLDHDVARTCAGILRIMLNATEQEHLFQLAADDPDDDTPSLTGVVIIGPGAPQKYLEHLGRPVENPVATTRAKGKVK